MKNPLLWLSGLIVALLAIRWLKWFFGPTIQTVRREIHAWWTNPSYRRLKK